MKTISNENSILPKLMNSSCKLMDSSYLKNIALKQAASESKFLPIIQRSSLISPTPSSQLNITKLIHSLDFSSRNYGASCDRGFQNKSRYHNSQKFGSIGINKLEPLKTDLLQKLTEIDQDDIIPKIEKWYFKKAYKIHNQSIMVLLKSAIIYWFRDQNDETYNKSIEPLQLNFSVILAIVNTYPDFIEFFKQNLYIQDKQMIKLRQKGLQSLNYTINNLKDDIFEEIVTLKNQSGQGYFKIHFPNIHLYSQLHQNNQILKISSQQLYEIIKDNFSNIKQVIEQFDFTKLGCEIKQQQLEEPQIINKPIENENENENKNENNLLEEQLKFQKTHFEYFIV